MLWLSSTFSFSSLRYGQVWQGVARLGEQWLDVDDSVIYNLLLLHQCEVFVATGQVWQGVARLGAVARC